MSREAPVRGQWEQALQTRDPMVVLEAIVAYEDFFEHAKELAVNAARASGRSWEDIAQVLGVRKQSAWGRYRTAQAAAAPEFHVLVHATPTRRPKIQDERNDA